MVARKGFGGRKGRSGGHNRKSDEQKRQEGRRIVKPKAKPVVAATAETAKPKPPQRLTREQKAVWAAFVLQLPVGGRYNPILIESYVVLVAAQRQMQAKGLASAADMRSYRQTSEQVRKLGAEIENMARDTVKLPAKAAPEEFDLMDVMLTHFTDDAGCWCATPLTEEGKRLFGEDTVLWPEE